MSENIILDTDSYKASHYLQYPPGLESLFCYLESRGGRYGQVLFFGLQYILDRYLKNPVTMDMVEEAQRFFAAHGEPFPLEGWKYVATTLNGKLPVRIRAVAEGTVVPNHNVLMTVESTDPKVPWLPTWLETCLMRVWYPITVATQSYNVRKLILGYLERTSDDPHAEIWSKLHDFGSRGVSSRESAAIGGAAHLINFSGSDTVVGVHLANSYYGIDMAGFSIPAAEHSTIIAWGEEGEGEAYSHILDRFATAGQTVAVVSDSYDLWNALEHLWGEKLRGKIETSGATVVLRPDSGEPVEVVCKTLELLESKFGYSYNTKAFRVLNHVRVLQGDGLTEEKIRSILEKMTSLGFSATNVAFGMGGALLQKVNRDTQRFAYKASEVVVGGESKQIRKSPATDPSKASKAGRLDLVFRKGKFETITGLAMGSSLELVYENGERRSNYTFDEIRKRAQGL